MGLGVDKSRPAGDDRTQCYCTTRYTVQLIHVGDSRVDVAMGMVSTVIEF